MSIDSSCEYTYDHGARRFVSLVEAMSEFFESLPIIEKNHPLGFGIVQWNPNSLKSLDFDNKLRDCL